MAPVDPLFFLFHIWSMSQFYADQAQQVRMFSPGTLDSEEGRERLIREVTAQVMRAGGVE
jgi:TetR/AcrR family transcriptional regulator